jgi:hypothetical protein
MQPIDPEREEKLRLYTALFVHMFPGEQFILITGAESAQPTAATNMTAPAVAHALTDLLRQLPSDDVQAQIPPEKRYDQ